MSVKLGIFLGFLCGGFVGIGFVLTTGEADAETSFTFSDPVILRGLFILIAVLLALANYISSFFPAFGLGFSCPAAFWALASAPVAAITGKE